MIPPIQGWGAGPWGATPWGGGGSADLFLLTIQAVRENVLRYTFNTAPLFNGLLGPKDASDPLHYQIVVVGGVGIDGEPCRPVLPVLVEVADVPNAAGAAIDVTVDRPFTAWPATYIGSANGLIAAIGGAFLLPGASAVFLGMRAGEPPPTNDQLFAMRDLANPQSGLDLQALGISIDPTLALGTYQVGASGDYITDTPLTSYRKRVYRRLITEPGRFAHLPNYGAGLLGDVKQLAKTGVREKRAAIAEEQIQLEPETLSSSVTFADEGNGVTRYKVTALTKMGPVSLDIPVGVGI